MTYLRNLLDKLLGLQDQFLSDPRAKQLYRRGEGKVSLLRIVGMQGEDILLKATNGRIEYADEDENPVHILRCSEDTALDVLLDEESIREAVTKGHFTIEDTDTREIDLVEMELWSSSFERLRGLIRKTIGVH